MERPKVTAQPTSRRITGEIVYLDEMRRAEQFPGRYEDLPDMAIQMYEESADLLEAHGVRPEIMNTYEKYDAKLDDLHTSCVALAEEFLSLKDPAEGTTFIDIIVEASPEEVLTKLHEAGLDRLFVGSKKQLAFKTEDPRYPEMDIRKRDAELTGVGLTIFGWSDSSKYFILSDEYSPLMYPQGEQNKWYQIELSFSYEHPEHGYFNEKITLSINAQGGLSLSTNVYVGAYSEQGYEGHDGKYLAKQTDDDVIRFAEIVAEIVGDEPMSMRQWHDRDLRQYIDRVCLAESAQYLREWLANSWSGQVSSDLVRTQCDSTSLAAALMTPKLAEAAHAQLVDLVNSMRSGRNDSAKDASMTEYFGEISPWQDLVER